MSSAIVHSCRARSGIGPENVRGYHQMGILIFGRSHGEYNEDILPAKKIPICFPITRRFPLQWNCVFSAIEQLDGSK
jgi:hypothetical protein